MALIMINIQRCKLHVSANLLVERIGFTEPDIAIEQEREKLNDPNE